MAVNVELVLPASGDRRKMGDTLHKPVPLCPVHLSLTQAGSALRTSQHRTGLSFIPTLLCLQEQTLSHVSPP